jgi:hypothetical protein
VKFPWRQAESAAPVGAPRTDLSEQAPHSCPSLVRALDRIFKHEKPEILDLGPFCGATAVYLADRGARVSVTEFQPPPPAPKAELGKKGELLPKSPLRIDQPDSKFHLVLAWEHGDYTPPDRLADFGAEVHRVLIDGGLVLLFALNNLSRDDPMARTAGRYRVVGDEQIVREPVPAPGRRRWTHPTREIERALAPLSIQGIHLQRNQMREFLALKR